MKNTILITGCCGFIGFSLAVKLLESKSNIIIGIDNINSYYDPNLKKKRLKILNQNKNFVFKKFDIANFSKLSQIFKKNKIVKIFHFAAQAGVQYSLKNPRAYQDSNVNGYFNLLELSRMYQVRNIYYASSSSVYGDSKIFPVKESFNLYPKNFYGLSKKINEEMSEVFANYYEINITGLRFFTVYGPWGRPDMALFLFTKAILENKPIQVFNNGEMIRDFTFIDDVVESLSLLLEKPAKANSNFDTYNPDPSSSLAPFKIFNIGNSKPVKIDKYIEAIELALNKKAKKEYLDIQPGDLSVTASNCDSLNKWIGFSPSTSIQKGVNKFIEWYRDFYKV